MSRPGPYTNARDMALYRYQQAINCFKMLSPLVVLNLIVPPYQYLQGVSDASKIATRTGLEYVYIIWEDLWGSLGFEVLKKGAYYIGCPAENYISYMFMHNTYDHLFSSMLKLCQYSFMIYSHINPTPYTLPSTITYFYLLYIGGGIVAALPSKLHDDDGKYNLIPYLKPLLNQTDLPYSDTLHKVVQIVTSKLGSLNVYPIVLGSTGALYALKGCYVILQLKQLFYFGNNIYLDLQRKYRHRPSQLFSITDVIDSTIKELKDQLFTVLYSIALIVSDSSNIALEYQAIYNNLEGKHVGNFMSHSIKVQGAVYGILFGLLFPAYK